MSSGGCRDCGMDECNATQKKQRQCTDDRWFRAHTQTGASEHGSPTVMVYNTHQPSSPKREFPQTMRINFCKAVLRDAVKYTAEHAANVAFVQAGDTN